MSKKNDFIMMKQTTQFCGDTKLADMVFLFDKRDFPDAEVLNEIIESGCAESGADPHIVAMTKAQYETVFRSLIQQDKEPRTVENPNGGDLYGEV